MFDTNQALRPSVAALIGLVATAFLAACDPAPNLEPDPSERVPPPSTPSAATDPRSAEAAPSDRAITAFPGGDAQPSIARAYLESVGGSSARGVVIFTPEASGMTAIHVRVSDLAPGEHGLHLHEAGNCSSPDGSSAGGHFAPEQDRHGSPDSEHAAHHAGDLGNVTADQNGNAEATIRDDELELEGDHGVVGRAVVVHLQADDLETQPTGNSGDPAACGVIEPVSHTGGHDVQ